MNEPTVLPQITAQVRVINKLGVHTRPATMIVKALHKVKCQVWFTVGKDRINAKSILSILMLAAKRNTSITIDAYGEGAQAVVDNLVELFESGFGE